MGARNPKREHRRIRFSAVLALAALLVGASGTGAPRLEARLGGLRRTPPSTEAFQEIGYRPALKNPLVISGRYTWLGGSDFERVTVAPFRETARAVQGELSIERERGRDRHVALSRVPVLSVVFGALASVLSGDAGSLRTLFDVELTGTSAWRIVLRPKDEQLRGRIDSVVLMGHRDRMRCVHVAGKGTETLTVLGMTETPLADASLAVLVERYCSLP